MRRPTRDDLGTMTNLERVAPIQRDDGTEVVKQSALAEDELQVL